MIGLTIRVPVRRQSALRPEFVADDYHRRGVLRLSTTGSTGSPAVCENTGSAVKDRMLTWPTFTVTLALDLALGVGGGQRVGSGLRRADGGAIVRIQIAADTPG